jgi:pyruvate formate lyase activating enzyme
MSDGHKSAIAYTYSEPLVHVEFLLDCMKEGREAGVANVLVSNGCVNSEAAAEILSLTDAANIDLKCYSRETYRDVLGGDLDAVTGFIRMAVEKEVHLELTTLVVPGLNDSGAELDKCGDFIAELQAVVPWHLSACHPDYKWHKPATDPQMLVNAANRAREKLNYVYTGNITLAGQNFNDTHCPHCGKILINRNGYRTNATGLQLREENGRRAYFCAYCGQTAPICAK